MVISADPASEWFVTVSHPEALSLPDSLGPKLLIKPQPQQVAQQFFSSFSKQEHFQTPDYSLAH